MDWRVKLKGDEFDLTQLADSMAESEPAITRQNDDFVLTSKALNAMEDVGAAWKMADELCVHLSGVATLVLSSRKQITASSLALVAPDGTQTAHVRASSTVRLRSIATITLTVGDSDPVSIRQADEVAGFLGLAAYENVAKVFRLLARHPTSWSDLYKIYELIKEDLGSDSDLIATGWTTKARLDLFRRTANHPDAAGDDARHGTSNAATPSEPMTLSEGSSYIRSILHPWLASKPKP